jgi:hypothetical protein
MSGQFWPCSGCSRHVKRGDPRCPFCGVESAPRPFAPAKASRLSRAAIFAGTVGAAVAVTDCGNSIVPYGQPPNLPPEDASMTQIPADSSTASEGSPSSNPPADASDDDDASDGADGGSSPNPMPRPQPAYGAPVPLYGGSPIPVERD